MALEKDLEYKCRQLVKARGGELLKFKSPGHRGVPDRILLMADYVAFVEFKKPKGGKYEPLQEWWQKWLHKKRLNAFVVRTVEDFKALLDDGTEWHEIMSNRRDAIRAAGKEPE